jgi:hypothetical protein
MVGLELPVLAMEHMYLVTDEMPEVVAYNKERDVYLSGIEQAKAEFIKIGTRAGAMTKDDLDDFEEGKAVIVGAALIKGGMLGVRKGEIWVTTSAQEMTLPTAGRVIDVKSAVAGFTWYSKNTKGWDAVVDDCAMLDEETISSHSDFNIGDTRLYSTHIPDVAKNVTRLPPSAYKYASQITLKAPQFPRPVDIDDSEVTPFIQSVVAEQSSVIEWTNEGKNYNGRKFRLKSIADGETGEHRVDVGDLVRYAISHSIKLAESDFIQFRLNYDLASTIRDENPEFVSRLMAAIPEIVEKSENAEGIAKAVNAFIESSFPYIAFDNHFPLQGMMTRAAQNLVSDSIMMKSTGGKPVKWLNDLLKSRNVVMAVSNFIAQDLPLKYGLNDDGSFKSLYMNDEDANAAFADEYLTAHAAIPNAWTLRADLQKVITDAFDGEMPAGAIVLDDKLGSVSRNTTAYQLFDARVKLSIAQKAMAGVDINAMLAGVKAVAGVSGADILTTDRTVKIFQSGTYTYKANQAIAVAMIRGSDNNTRLSNGADGLQGRHWDSAKKAPGGLDRWLLTLGTNEKDTRGKGVASADDFIKFFK